MGRKIVIETASLADQEIRSEVVEISDEEEQFAQGVRDVLSELPESQDLTILTLKGHLIIEQMLVKMIEVSARNPKALKDLDRLPFSVRVSFAQSLVRATDWSEQRLWPLVRKIGRIRNDIAHQLRPRKLDEQIELFIDLFINAFGAQLIPPVPESARKNVTKGNVLIPQEMRGKSRRRSTDTRWRVQLRALRARSS